MPVSALYTAVSQYGTLITYCNNVFKKYYAEQALPIPDTERVPYAPKSKNQAEMEKREKYINILWLSGCSLLMLGYIAVIHMDSIKEFFENLSEAWSSRFY
jgi:hypothetical protein